MKALRVTALVLSLGLFGALFLTSTLASSASAASYGRTIVGELVAQGSKFRIVGHGSGYTPPPGTPLTALDGKNVEVEFSPDGRVTRITEVPVPINPVTHGWSTVRGHLTVVDPNTRAFTFSGDTQTYVAPPNVNITSFAGQQVEAKMDENNRVTELRLIGPSTSGAYYPPAYNPPAYNPPSSYNPPSYNPPSAYNPPPAYYPPVASAGCTYEGQTYSAGSAVCQSGTQYRCDGNQWQSLGTACRVSAAGDAPGYGTSPRSCIIGDATVANNSSICRSGVTYRCDDGAWINVQTPCQ